MPLLLDLFCAFFRIGLFTFGGGYAMLPLLQREIVEKKKWATEEEMLDYFAVGQCTPGVIAVNTATFVGFKEKKLSGAIFATLGIVSPSLVIITVIAALPGVFRRGENAGDGKVQLPDAVQRVVHALQFQRKFLRIIHVAERAAAAAGVCRAVRLRAVR